MGVFKNTLQYVATLLFVFLLFVAGTVGLIMVRNGVNDGMWLILANLATLAIVGYMNRPSKKSTPIRSQICSTAEPSWRVPEEEKKRRAKYRRVLTLP
jgi:hypothetical protein